VCIFAHRLRPKQVVNLLNAGKSARLAELTPEEDKCIKGLMLLSRKPVIYAANVKVSEKEGTRGGASLRRKGHVCGYTLTAKGPRDGAIQRRKGAIRKTHWNFKINKEYALVSSSLFLF
jgi:hypothetical protein